MNVATKLQRKWVQPQFVTQAQNVTIPQIEGFKKINASLYLNYRQLKSNKIILSKHEDSQFHSIVCFPILAAD